MLAFGSPQASAADFVYQGLGLCAPLLLHPFNVCCLDGQASFKIIARVVRNDFQCHDLGTAQSRKLEAAMYRFVRKLGAISSYEDALVHRNLQRELRLKAAQRMG